MQNKMIEKFIIVFHWRALLYRFGKLVCVFMMSIEVSFIYRDMLINNFYRCISSGTHLKLSCIISTTLQCFALKFAHPFKLQLLRVKKFSLQINRFQNSN